jgi:hypothetical protein
MHANGASGQELQRVGPTAGTRVFVFSTANIKLQLPCSSIVDLSTNKSLRSLPMLFSPWGFNGDFVAESNLGGQLFGGQLFCAHSANLVKSY